MWNSVHCICHQTSAVSSDLHELPAVVCITNYNCGRTSTVIRLTLHNPNADSRSKHPQRRQQQKKQKNGSPRDPPAILTCHLRSLLCQMLRMQPSHDDPLRRVGTQEPSSPGVQNHHQPPRQSSPPACLARSIGALNLASIRISSTAIGEATPQPIKTSMLELPGNAGPLGNFWHEGARGGTTCAVFGTTECTHCPTYCLAFCQDGKALLSRQKSSCQARGWSALLFVTK